jgi:hypothetical protein
MIGTQPEGTLPGIVISATSHEGLRVTIDGKPAKLAIVTGEGEIVASGEQVAREAEAVALNNYRRTLQGQGFLRTWGKPIEAITQGTGGMDRSDAKPSGEGLSHG